jgi:hypothetical protein
VTQRGDIAMAAGGEVAPERRNGGDDVSWTDANLIG